MKGRLNALVVYAGKMRKMLQQAIVARAPAPPGRFARDGFPERLQEMRRLPMPPLECADHAEVACKIPIAFHRRLAERPEPRQMSPQPECDEEQQPHNGHPAVFP